MRHLTRLCLNYGGWAIHFTSGHRIDEISVVHGGDFTNPNQVFWEASNSFNEFKRVYVQEHDARSPFQEVIPTPWKKPSIDMFKLNWGVAVNKGHGHIRIGIVMSNYEGVVVVSLVTAYSTTKGILVKPVVDETFASL